MFDDPRPEDEAPAEPTGNARSQWHGRIARDAQGRRIMWQEPPNGRGGRFVQLSEATATPQSREALQGYRDELGLLERLAPLAQDYVRVGNTTPTGGWAAQSVEREAQKLADPVRADDLFAGFNDPSLGLWNTGHRDRLNRLRGLENEAVRANIRPGTSGASNSIFEQQVIRDMFPNTLVRGQTNSERAASIFVRRDLQRRRVAAAERWLQEHPDLSHFEESWAQQLDQMRPQLEAHYRRHFNLDRLTPEQRRQRRSGSVLGAIVGAGGPAARRAPAATEQGDDFVRDPQTGRLVRRRR